MLCRMPAHLDRPDAPYLQIAHQLRQRIESGALAPGERVPSAREIAAEWSVALVTASKALAALSATGLTEARPGLGTFVTE